MRGGFVVSTGPELFEQATSALAEFGAVGATDDLGDRMMQCSDQDGRLFTLFERVPAGTEWEVSDEPIRAAPHVDLPDMRAVIACPFECRWPDLAARLIAAIARTAKAPVWVLDGDGVLWAADAVDPTKIRL